MGRKMPTHLLELTLFVLTSLVVFATPGTAFDVKSSPHAQIPDPPRTPIRVLKSKLEPSSSQDGVNATTAASTAAAAAAGGGGTGSAPPGYYYYYYYQYSPSIVPAGPPHARPVISTPPTQKLVKSPPQSFPKSPLPPLPPFPPLPLDPRTVLNHPSVPSPPPPPVPSPSVAGVNGNATSGAVLINSKYVWCLYLITFLMVALL